MSVDRALDQSPISVRRLNSSNAGSESRLGRDELARGDGAAVRRNQRNPVEKICIVDDDESVRTSLLRLMRSAGFAAEAFAAAEEFLQDEAVVGVCTCAVVDVHLTGMSGLQLQQELNDRATVPPVVMMTAFEDPDLRQRAMDGGAVAFLRKPFDDNVLLDAVSKAAAGAAKA